MFYERGIVGVQETDKDHDSYEIQWGDTLSKIALNNNTTVEALAQLNGIEDPDRIRAGGSLVIPIQPQKKKEVTIPPQQAARQAAFEEAAQKYAAAPKEKPTRKEEQKPPPPREDTAIVGETESGSHYLTRVGTGSVRKEDADPEAVRNWKASETYEKHYKDKEPSLLDSREPRPTGRGTKGSLLDVRPREEDETSWEKRHGFASPEVQLASRREFAPNRERTEAILSRHKDRSEPLLPTNIRQLFYDVFGGEDVITEDTLKKKELSSLRETVVRAIKRGSPFIEYEDYATGTKYGDVGGGPSSALAPLTKLGDPAYSMKTLLGQATITTNDKGETIIVDQYNFNNAVDGNLIDYLAAVKGAGASLYAQGRAFAKHFGSHEGEGSPVLINLGKLNV